ncbi:MAG: BrnA antitoxin family protein [Alphaproteobacteria bacterium]|nr:BrnA antitoxin family protein [Alphaproteobacteria bacterium]
MRKTHSPLIEKNGEVRPLRAGDQVHASRLRDSFPDLAAYAQKRKVGRPKSAAKKQLQSFKLSPDVIASIRSSGAGYNVRVEAVLREALNEGRI